jgi:hypothetical protein
VVEATTILFFLNHVLCKTGRTPGEPTGKTSSIFLKLMPSFKKKKKHIYIDMSPQEGRDLSTNRIKANAKF